MKLGEKLRKTLLESSAKTGIEVLEPLVLELANNLEKGCILKFKNFTFEERKDLIKSLEAEDIQAIGEVSYTENLFYNKLDLKYMNQEYFLIWDDTAIKKSECSIPYPCDSCTTPLCQDGYHCNEINDWCKNDGKTIGVSYDVTKEICIEKCELGYKVSVTK